mmetsp:Transcript_2592/g.4819  ORF Transcript_2592/g.4819 Transcript_2592/m.4819 type:complete len:234 (+) Transcript_2592:2094-2795(+)
MGPLRAIVHLLTVGEDLREFAPLHEGVDHLEMGTALEIDLQRQISIVWLQNVPKLLAFGKLLLCDELLDVCRTPLLLQDDAGQLHRLKIVQLALVKQMLEIHRQSWLLPRQLRDCLEALNGLTCAQKPMGSLSHQLHSLLNVHFVEEVVKLGHEQIVGAAQIRRGSNAEGHLVVIALGLHKFDDGIVVDGNVHDCATRVNAEDSVGRLLLRSSKNGVLSDDLSMQQRSCRYIE